MQLDSHRRQLSASIRNYISQRTSTPTQITTPAATDVNAVTSTNMPCRFSRSQCCTSSPDYTAEDGTKMQTWHTVRRENIRSMRRQVKHIILGMALIEAMRVGPVQLVYAGKQGFPEPGPDDFGIAHTVGYILAWLFVCLFSVVWVPLFSWWVPSTQSDPEHPGNVEKLSAFLQQLNLIILPISVLIRLVQYSYFAIMTFVFVDARSIDAPLSLPANTQKNWMARLMLLVGVCTSLTCGYGAFQILAEMDLAHVKCIEYAVIVVPIQINLGVLLGSAMQWRMEKRGENKKAALKATAEEGIIEEKQALLDV